jgi:hypothetical protein
MFHLSDADGETFTCYRHIVRNLVYLGVTHHIFYFLHIVSQLVSVPTQLHYSHLFRVLCYLRDTISYDQFFPCTSYLQLKAYCNAT